MGHDDANLERTFYELETLLAKSLSGEIHCSDATGWDLSVSAASFWSALEMRLCRAKSEVQTAAYLVNAFFQQAWVVSTGTGLWESYRFGITASGSSITTSANTEERQMGSKAASDIEALGGMVEFEKLEPHEMKELSQTTESQRTAAGDDLLNARKHSTEVLSALGTIERGSKICNGTPERPIEYLSHLYFKKDGKWRCEYDNGPKLLHRIAHVLSQPYETRSSDDRVKIQAAVAGQRFVLRNTPRLETAYLSLVRALAPGMPIPVAEDNGEA